jgi:ABC-type multidrug transport system fused ATPase/permease subunit
VRAAALGVRFEAVGFTYTDREPVLDGVTFEAPAPGLTAVVGPSGAGKTTLFSLLMRFYDLDRGRVTIGGVDVATLPLHELRRLIGYVEQDAPALEGTLGENLVYAAPAATPADVADVLARTRLDELVDRLPSGLETVVGSRGVLLSGGERQRLAIARALLRVRASGTHAELLAGDALYAELAATQLLTAGRID